MAQLAVYYSCGRGADRFSGYSAAYLWIMIDRLELCLLRMIRDDAIRVVHP